MRTHDSPYVTFSREEWLNFRHDAPMTLTEADLDALHGQVEQVSLQEVSDIYLPLSRLLSFYVSAAQNVHRATQDFLGTPEPKVPYIIGVAGSVAVGKSTSSRILKALLSRWPNHPSVSVITTDGFLYPNYYLEQNNLMSRKGFPESYDVGAFLQFLMDVKSGKSAVRAPVYSHQSYDILPNAFIEVHKPDILIVEGLNILQTGNVKPMHAPVFISDFFDFSIFVDAEMEVIRQWYIDRVIKFSQTSFQDKESYFHHISQLSAEEVRVFAAKIWRDINAVNLMQNILPYRDRAQLILKKDKTHAVEEVRLRKL